VYPVVASIVNPVVPGLHPSSSEPSAQLLNPLHLPSMEVHSPLLQKNWTSSDEPGTTVASDRHTVTDEVSKTAGVFHQVSQPSSSEPSLQLAKPLHRAKAGTQNVPKQRKVSPLFSPGRKYCS